MDQATANVKQIKREAGVYKDDAQRTAVDAYNQAKGMSKNVANNVVSPETRRDFYNGVKSFCIEQPYIASFMATQSLFNAVPIGIFSSFCLGLIIFTFFVGLCFVMFWVGAAMLVLVPVLAITGTFAIATWAWMVGSFLAMRWIYSMTPLSVRGVTEVGMPSGKKLVVSKSGEGYGDVHANVERNGVQ